jgi:hypothetical protein
MKSRKEITGIRPGIMSVTVVFSALCLTVFAVLTLMTAKTGARQAEKEAAALAAYYEADGRCAAFSRELYSLWKSGSDFGELKARAEELGGTCREDGDALAVGYTAEIDDARQLDVGIEISASSFEITKWQTVGRGDWTPDEKLNVWEGE